MASKTFEDLLVWQKAHSFVLEIYKISEDFPKTEVYGLTSQFQRASVSIAANIAEGFKKKGKNDKLRFYNISQGSIEECRYYLILAKDLKYFDLENYNRVSEMLNSCSYLLNTYCSSIVKDEK